MRSSHLKKAATGIAALAVGFISTFAVRSLVQGPSAALPSCASKPRSPTSSGASDGLRVPPPVPVAVATSRQTTEFRGDASGGPVRAAPPHAEARLGRDGEAPQHDASWDAIPVSNVMKVWSPETAADFQLQILTEQTREGLREHCQYQMDVPVRPQLKLSLNVEAHGEELVVSSVDVLDPHVADEYQQHCVSQWFTGLRATVQNAPSAGRYRIEYPVRL